MRDARLGHRVGDRDRPGIHGVVNGHPTLMRDPWLRNRVGHGDRGGVYSVGHQSTRGMRNGSSRHSVRDRRGSGVNGVLYGRLSDGDEEVAAS